MPLMRLLVAATLAVAPVAPFATCGRSPATGVTYDCPDGRAFTVTHADSSTALVRVDGATRRLTSATRPATRWTDSTVTLTTAGDTARLARGDVALHEGCIVRNPELRR